MRLVSVSVSPPRKQGSVPCLRGGLTGSFAPEYSVVMTAPSRPEPTGPPAQVPVVRVAPISAPWQEAAVASPPCPAPIVPSYQAVEVAADPGTPRPIDADQDEPCYPLVARPAADPAEARRRRLEDAHLLDLLDLPGPRRPPRRLLPEMHWYQCLSYPLVVLPILIGFAPILSLATVWLIFLGIDHHRVWRRLCDHHGSSLTVGKPLTILGYACGFLQGVLNAAVAGLPPPGTFPVPGHFRTVPALCRQMAVLFPGRVRQYVLGGKRRSLPGSMPAIWTPWTGSSTVGTGLHLTIAYWLLGGAAGRDTQ